MAYVNKSNHITVVARNAGDIVIVITPRGGENLFFPLKKVDYTETFAETVEHGTGQHRGYDITDGNIDVSGSFDIGTWIEATDLDHIDIVLTNQDDEGQPVFFDIQFNDRIGNATVEQLSECKLTDLGIDVTEGATAIKRYSFVGIGHVPS